MKSLAQWWGAKWWFISPPIQFLALLAIAVALEVVRAYQLPDFGLDLNLHDTYLAVSLSMLLWPVIAYAVVNALAYWLLPVLMKRPMVRWLAYVHGTVSIFGFLWAWYTLHRIISSALAANQEAASSSFDFPSFALVLLVPVGGALLEVLLLVNCGITAFRFFTDRSKAGG